ncbi:Transmembrane protein [Phytophthora cinnamomi]|uniref:Transmembrane protein n=1 Tax=Phytophthora cinnamomi TaxID=4785 RepID=UPI00355A68EF|nr:Transmembrane protein [Phytophthora cinnamomi]
MADNAGARPKSGLQRLWSFGRDGQLDLRPPSSTTQAADTGAAAARDGDPGTPPSVIRHRRADPRADFRLNMFTHSFSSDAVTEAMSSRRSDPDEDPEDNSEERSIPHRHRRVKSYTGSADWQLLDSGPTFRPRTYTKSLEYLNHVMEAHFQRTMVNRLFAINWISFFLWFMLISFVIIPFGDEVETWLSANLKYTKLTVRWQGGVIDMSTAFVTPLLITQALNLLIDTSLPIIFRRETLRASKLAKKIMKANPAETLLALSEYHSSFENLSSDLSQSPSSRSVAFKTKIELQMMTPIRIPYLEEALGVSIPTLEGFENEKYFMTADDVLEESQLPLYNAFPDYLRMVIQYGYVVMFSVVWPFCAMAAFANNIIHIQNSFYKLVLLRRRPVPRKSNSIGQWEKMLFITLCLAIFVVVGLICVSTGELEYFISECMALERFNGKDFSMGPEFSCLDISSRFIVALILEHAAILIVYVLTDYISDTPASVRTSFERKKELIRRAICGQGPPTTPKSDGKGVQIHHGTKSFETA